jgi:hypothetical protein
MEHPRITPTIRHAGTTAIIGMDSHHAIADGAIPNSITLPLKTVAIVMVANAVTAAAVVTDHLTTARTTIGQLSVLLTATRILDIELLIPARAIMTTHASMTAVTVATRLGLVRWVQIPVSVTMRAIVIKAIDIMTQTKAEDMGNKGATSTVDTHAILTVITAPRATLIGVIDPLHPVASEDLTRKTHAGKAVLPCNAATLIQGQGKLFREIDHKKSNLRAITSVLRLQMPHSILQHQASFRITFHGDLARRQMNLRNVR